MYIYKLSLSTLLIALVALQKSIAIDDNDIQWIQQHITQELQLQVEPSHTDFLEALKKIDAIAKTTLDQDIFVVLDQNIFQELAQNTHTTYTEVVTHELNHFPQVNTRFVTNQDYHYTISDTDRRMKIAADCLQLRI